VRCIRETTKESIHGAFMCSLSAVRFGRASVRHTTGDVTGARNIASQIAFGGADRGAQDKYGV